MSLNQLSSTLQRISEIRELLGVDQLSTPSPAMLPVPDSSARPPFSDVLENQMNPVPRADPANAPLTGNAPSLLNADLAAKIEQHARTQGVDPALMKALVQTESAFNPNAKSPAGAMGLTQLMPDTAKELGVTQPFNVDQNLAGGTQYIKGLLNQYHSVPVALGAYNAGPGAVNRYRGIPPYKETQNYVKTILNRMQQFDADSVNQP